MQPVSQFCCGCSIVFGVKCVLYAHLLFCICSCALAIGDIILKLPDFGFQGGTTRKSEIYLAGWALAGIPIILIALFGGVARRIESHMRIYLYYAMATVAIDVFFLVDKILLTDSCGSLSSIVATEARAYACGVARTLSYSSSITLILLQMYLVFVIWSYCEDLAEGGSGGVLADLIFTGKEPAGKMGSMAGAASYGIHAMDMGGGYSNTGSNYGGHMSGLGGSTPLFGNDVHYMPPVRD